MKIETHFVEDPTAKTKSFYAKGEDLGVSLDLVDQLLRGSNGQNARLCLHQGAEDSFHQMLILEYWGKSFPAHRHPNKSEGYHLIEGQMDLVLYTNSGDVSQVIKLNERNPIARVGPNTFHKLVVLSPYAIYHETKPGPFDRSNDKVMALWSK